MALIHMVKFYFYKQKSSKHWSISVFFTKMKGVMNLALYTQREKVRKHSIHAHKKMISQNNSRKHSPFLQKCNRFPSSNDLTLHPYAFA
jgi:hypothetical protein